MIALETVTKSYLTGKGRVDALSEVSLRVEPGQFVVLTGPSGCGKTTLLMTVAAMLRPSSGTVKIDADDLYAMGVRDRADFRARNIGFVFQMFHLVPYLNVTENVLLAGGAVGRKGQSGRVAELLDRLGLTGRATHRPAQLSAGEKQRVAIARALLNEPKIILADEPTGNLDPDNAAVVLSHLQDFHKAGGTVIVATHGPMAKDYATRTVTLRNGRIDGDA